MAIIGPTASQLATATQTAAIGPITLGTAGGGGTISNTGTTSSLTIPTTTGSGGTIPTSSDALLQSTVSSILGYQSQAAIDAANAAAATTSAAGYTADRSAYQTAADIAAPSS